MKTSYVHPFGSRVALAHCARHLAVALLMVAFLANAVASAAPPLPLEGSDPQAPPDLATPSDWPPPLGFTVTGLATPNGLALNPYTNRLYVTSRNNRTVLMVNAATMQTMQQAFGGISPFGIAVNPVTNKVYAADFADDDIRVFDGATLNLLTIISVGGSPQPALLAVMPSTNQIFVALHGANTFAVIDGAQDRLVYVHNVNLAGAWAVAVDDKRQRLFVSSRDSRLVHVVRQFPRWGIVGAAWPCDVARDGSPFALAFNPTNDRLYVACAHHNNVDTAVVYHVGEDDRPREIGRVSLPSGGADGGGGVAVNTTTGNAFFSNSLSGSVSVVGGPSNRAIATLPTGVDPFGVAVDPLRGRVYVGDRAGNRIFVFADQLDATAVCYTQRFVWKGDYPTGPRPWAVAAADLDRNGFLDLVTANKGDDLRIGDVSVLLRRNDGTWQPAINYAAGLHPVDVVVEDFNRDNSLDLAVVNEGPGDNSRGTVTVLLGQGNGSFVRAADFEVGQRPSSLVASDFNRDGKLDLVVANTSPIVAEANSLSVLLGNGDGTFGRRVDYRVGPSPNAVAVGDFSSDLKPDMVATLFYLDSVSVLLGDGTGAFQPAVNYPVGGPPFSAPEAVAIGDLNSDGKPDLAVANGLMWELSVLLGNGNGTFQNCRNFGPSGRRLPAAIALADFNRDAKLDVAIAEKGEDISMGSLFVWLGGGDGTFPGWWTDYRELGAYPVDLAIGDFDRDGMPDVATANSGDNTLSIMLNRCMSKEFLPLITR